MMNKRVTTRIRTEEQKNMRRELNSRPRFIRKRNGTLVAKPKVDRCYLCQRCVDQTMVLEQCELGATRHAHKKCLLSTYPRPHNLQADEYRVMLEDQLCERVREKRACAVCKGDITYHEGLCRAIACMARS